MLVKRHYPIAVWVLEVMCTTLLMRRAVNKVVPPISGVCFIESSFLGRYEIEYILID